MPADSAREARTVFDIVRRVGRPPSNSYGKASGLARPFGHEVDAACRRVIEAAGYGDHSFIVPATRSAKKSMGTERTSTALKRTTRDA